MFRLLKALPLALGLAALTFFTTSCGSGSQAQLRVVNAIPDSPPAGLDVDVNGTKITTAALTFTGVQPTPPAYTKVASGSDTIAALDFGTSTQVFSSTASLSGSAQYTVVLAGFLSSPAAYLLTDTNTAPASGNLEFRVIDASVFTPVGGFDVYITPPGGNITGVTPQTINLGQATTYESVANAGYNVVVIAHGGTIPAINQGYAELDGSIRTVVIVDNQGGGSGPASFPLLLNDLN
jgi:hypothetical protein